MRVHWASGFSFWFRAACGGICLLVFGLGGTAVAADKAAESDTLIDYTAADNSFSARLPGYWKVDEKRYESLGASFFGPSDYIGVFYYRAKDAAEAAQRHLLSQAMRSTTPVPIPVMPPGKDKPKPNRAAVAGHQAWETSIVTSMPAMHNIPAQQYQERIVVVVMKDGYFSLKASCRLPEPCTWVAFETLLASFRPGSAVK